MERADIDTLIDFLESKAILSEGMAKRYQAGHAMQQAHQADSELFEACHDLLVSIDLQPSLSESYLNGVAFAEWAEAQYPGICGRWHEKRDNANLYAALKPMVEKLNHGEPLDAPEKREVPQGDIFEHQDGDQGGQAAETGRGARALDSARRQEAFPGWKQEAKEIARNLRQSLSPSAPTRDLRQDAAWAADFLERL